MQHVTETMVGRAPVRFESYIREEGPVFAAAIHINQESFMLQEFLDDRERRYAQAPLDALRDVLPDGCEPTWWEQVDGRFNDYILVTGRIVESPWDNKATLTPDQVCEWIDDG